MSDANPTAVRGPLLVPQPDGLVRFFADGCLVIDAAGTLVGAGDFAHIAASLDPRAVRPSRGILMPPFIDLHTHIPQHPIRGDFVAGIREDAPEGRLLAGLRKNVFPAEARCHDPLIAQQVIEAFAADTLRHGVVGGSAYMMVSPRATELALGILPPPWSVGMVLMNQNAPADLMTHEPSFERDIEALVRSYGTRCVITDRFAVGVDSRLRRRASAVAGRFGLRTQTHLNEQAAEKRFVEQTLYPEARSYTHVYLDDGLLDHRCIVAHCIHMRDDEWSLLRDTGAAIAHCPTSNLLLGSGTLSLEAVHRFGIPFAIATDVGASPTVSMLAEMRRFVDVHTGRSLRATSSEALFRATLAPAQILGIDSQVGRLEVGRPASFIEVAADLTAAADADAAIRCILPANPDSPELSVNRVTIAGRIAYDRPGPSMSGFASDRDA